MAMQPGYPWHSMAAGSDRAPSDGALFIWADTERHGTLAKGGGQGSQRIMGLKGTDILQHHIAIYGNI